MTFPHPLNSVFGSMEIKMMMMMMVVVVVVVLTAVRG
jgi:hypothetical protein